MLSAFVSGPVVGLASIAAEHGEVEAAALRPAWPANARDRGRTIAQQHFRNLSVRVWRMA
jgi:hypothetical protein